MRIIFSESTLATIYYINVLYSLPIRLFISLLFLFVLLDVSLSSWAACSLKINGTLAFFRNFPAISRFIKN